VEAGGFPVDAAHVHADGLDLLSPDRAQGVQEGDQGGLRATFPYPHHVACVVVRNDGQELPALAVGDLIYPDAGQLV
jgi:hypothetical protein